MHNLIAELFPLPARERMKVRVLIQRAISRANQDSASFQNSYAEVTHSSLSGRVVRKRIESLFLCHSERRLPERRISTDAPASGVRYAQLSYERNDMKMKKNRLALAALSLAILGAAGCANLQPPAPAPAPEEVHAGLAMGGAMLLSIYHPDTRTMYIWAGDPRPGSRRPMTCTKLQLSDNPGTAPKGQPCP